MARMTQKQRDFWRTALTAQLDWMNARGRTQAGYRKFYSSLDADQCDAIYTADLNELHRLEKLQEAN